MAILAAVVAWNVDWYSLRVLEGGHVSGLLMLVVLGLVSEHQAVRTVLGDRGGSHSITFIPLSASVILFGPAAPVVFIGVVGTVAEFLFRRKPIDRGIFNVSQYLISAAVAGWVFGALGGPVSSSPEQISIGGLIWPFVAFGVTLLLLNQAFVSLAISLSQGTPFTEVIQKMAGPTGATALYDLLISPVSLVVALLYVTFDSSWGLLLAIFPLLFIRHAYLLNFRLQQANRDLLKALVKAIETRDPYTSGHSLRVQALAGRIASAMGLPEFRKRNIEHAALLHDIGKIDAIYSEILKKPDALSASEREVIESHVSKGVELLTSISSFSREVIEAVQYHHEREDGKGYPHGLTGDSIPLGAKIINVCDAIDAMLSDRPYRAALSTETVRQELVRYRGVQFDAKVIDHVVAGRLLEEHAIQVRTENRSPVSEALIEGLGSMQSDRSSVQAFRPED